MKELILSKQFSDISEHTKTENNKDLQNYEVEITDEINFQLSLKSEFIQFEKDHQSITGIFDPEIELQKIRALPRKQKREAMTIFKKKLTCQRDAWATCRDFISKKIEINHDIKKQDLVDWINTFSNEYGFTESQKQLAEEVIDDYYASRKRAKAVRKQYPNDIKLVSELTGLELDKNAEISAVVGLMAIDIYCHGDMANYLYNKLDNTISFIQGNGFAAESKHTPPIKYNIFVFSSDTNSVKLHEDQHQEFKLFEQRFNQTPNKSWTLWDQYTGEQDPIIKKILFELYAEDIKDKSQKLWNQYKKEQNIQLKKILLEKYFKAERDEALVRVKDELFAMKRDGDDNSYDIWFRGDSSYDYLVDVRDKEKNNLYQEYYQKILVKEYKEIIENAIIAFDQLKKESGFSTYKTIAFLTDIPLTQWAKVVRRQLEKD